MTEFIYYAADYVALRTDLPMRKFAAYFLVYGIRVSPIDRTGTIKFPVKTRSLFPIPKIEGEGFKLSYSDVCDARAVEILVRAEKYDLPIHVFWSGGVDSTTVLISLLRAAGPAGRERITVLLSEDSIAEYPEFYRNHIRGRLRCDSAMLFPHMLGATNALLVNGEGNDQLMGSDIMGDVANRFGADVLKEDYNRTFMHAFLASRMGGDGDTANLYVKLFERLAKAAPIDLKTNFDRLWWVNFAVKWQTVYVRTLSYAAKANILKVTKKWAETYYIPFFMNENFQLWSMHNTDKRMRDGWDSYKWPAKELIYQFTKDPVYRDSKLKRGSLQFLITQHAQHNFIDSTYTFHDDVEPVDFYREDHDFK